ncbi:hypothetical protein [Cupriavidus basilensis]|uniref:Uncharacterized protein n=1 Tax=Cupriavidus basilensis TaxID=68895 RepID=A0A0C4YPG9_9BURK|nr:hypothetical protein [Cupriavidus basilensis]AJG24375.1 hypothetical protein RR42_s2794 [Cupriavidus basilensis]
MSAILIHDLSKVDTLESAALAKIYGGIFRKVLMVPDYKEPTVIYDDGINIRTTDPSKSNVGYDSPFTPIPA